MKNNSKDDYPDIVDYALESISRQNPSISLAFNRWGSLLASGYQRGQVVLWDYHTKENAKQLLGHTKGVTSLSWSRNGKYLLSSSLDCTVKLWNVLSGKEEHSITCPVSVIHSCIHIPSDKTLSNNSISNYNALIVLSDGQAFYINLADPSFIKPLFPFSPNGKILFTEQNEVKLIQSNDSNNILNKQTTNDDIHTHSKNLPIEHWTCCEFLFKKIRKKNRKLFKSEENTNNNKLKQEILNNDKSNRYENLGFLGGSRGTIIVFFLDTLFIKNRLQLSSGVKSISFSNDQLFFLVTCNDKVIRLFDCDMLELLREFQDVISHQQWIKAFFSPNSENILCGVHDKGLSKIYVWNRMYGQLLKILDGPKEGMITLTPHPTSSCVVSCSPSGFVYIWSRTYHENWAAIAPDFQEVQENFFYIEKEDEFDIKEDTMINESNTQNGINEDEFVDIITIEKKKNKHKRKRENDMFKLIKNIENSKNEDAFLNNDINYTFNSTTVYHIPPSTCHLTETNTDLVKNNPNSISQNNITEDKTSSGLIDKEINDNIHTKNNSQSPSKDNPTNSFSKIDESDSSSSDSDEECLKNLPINPDIDILPINQSSINSEKTDIYTKDLNEINIEKDTIEMDI